jgi:hypothetical protein
MGSICLLARRVVFWLGHGDLQQTLEATQYVKFIANGCRQYDRDRTLEQKNLERCKALDLHVDAFPSTVGNSLQELYDRPWFSRV